MKTLYIAIVRNRISFSLDDDIRKFISRVKREYKCEVQTDFFNSSIDLEWEPYNVGGYWGPKGLKEKLAAAQILPPKHLYHVVYFIYDAADYPEPGPLANWTYPHDFNGSAFCFLAVKKPWLSFDNLATGLWHEGCKHGFFRILSWRGKPLIDTTDNWGSEANSDKMVVPLLKAFKDTILLPPSGRVEPPKPPQDDPVERKRLLGLLDYLKGVLASLTAKAELPTLYPKVARMRDALVDRMAAIGHPIKVTGEYRSPADQDALYALGRTKPGKIVTNAKGGESFHNWRCAFDVVFLTANGISYEGPWEALGTEAEKIGLEWGGRFASFPDRPHLQYRAGYNLSDFQKGRIDPVKFW